MSIDDTLRVEAIFNDSLTENMKYPITMHVQFNGTAQPLTIRNLEISEYCLFNSIAILVS